MDSRGALVFIIFCMISFVGFALYYAIKCSRRFAAKADQRREAREDDGTEMA